MAREMRIPVHEQYINSVYTYQVDLTVLDQELNVTSSTVTWSTNDSSIVSIGTSSFGSKIATAPITASSEGIATVKLAIATGGNDAPVYFFKINVIDPQKVNERSSWR